jgi:hypothetical protein
MSFFTRVGYSDTGSLDAFSRLRTSNPETLFSTQTQYNAGTLQMETGNTGTGVAPSHSSNTRMVTLSATAGSGTSFIQSFQYTPYDPGKSQFIAITGVMGTAVANAVVDVGYFDAGNGIIYRQNGTSGRQFILRTSTSGSVSNSNFVDQANWNLDKMDGTGVSGKNLVDTNSFILIIDLQFLGMGRVRMGFDIDGVVYYAHQFLNANVLSMPYMQTATLPVQMLVTATATATTKTASFKCAVVQSEGGHIIESGGFIFSTPEATATAGNTTRVPLIAIRPKTTFNSITNRTLFVLQSVNLFVTGNQDVFWELVIGGNYSGQSWADVNATHSSFEYTSTPGTFTNLTGGIVLMSGYSSRVGGTNNGSPIMIPSIASMKYPISLDRAGAVRSLGTLTLLVTGVSNTSACRASVNFKEIR